MGTPIFSSRTEGRRHSILPDFLSESLPISPSFLGTSPIVREILSRDIAECSSDDEDDHAGASDAESISGHEDATLAFHPNGIVYGTGYSLVPIQGMDKPVPNPDEVEEPPHAELSLLRDNAILPLKHHKPRPTHVLARLYRRIFSTKVKDHEGPIFPDIAVETTPLLHEMAAEFEPLPTPAPDEIERRFEFAVAHHEITTTWQREAKTLIQYSMPLIAIFLMHYSVTIGSVLTAGRLGLVELAAVNLATMTARITCYVPLQGLATCLDTLCAQAYGSGHKHLVGLQAQRMTWLLFILMAPIPMAATFLRVLIAGMPGVAMLESGKRFVQSQSLFKAAAYALMIGRP
ncbi:hypothetical protein VTI74DRAFT_10687 [Chaetomium olivicolor]